MGAELEEKHAEGQRHREKIQEEICGGGQAIRDAKMRSWLMR
jgi:hypothetical protein